MADPNDNNSNKTTAPVDIETMKVKLLIVCKEQGRLDTIANFLNRRGWEAQVTTKVKEALALVTTMKPDFVLVSANHPNPKLMKFPNILRTSFQVPTIGFAELNDAKTQNILQSLPVDHRMVGSLSGPSTQRRIKQILREMHGVNSEGTQRVDRKSGKADNDNHDIVMRGGKKSESEYVSVKGGGQPATKPDAAYKPKHGEEAEYDSSEDDYAEEENTFVSGEEGSTNSTLAASGKRSSQLKNNQKEFGLREGLPSADDPNDDELDLDALELPSAVTASETTLIPEEQNPTVLSEDFTLDPEDIEDIVAGLKKDMSSSPMPASISAAAAMSAPKMVETSTTTNATVALKVAARETKNDNARGAAAPVRKIFTKDLSNISYFEKLVIKILNEISEKRQETAYRVDDVEKLVVISVESPNTNGYLVVASSATSKGLHEMCVEVKDKLADFLRQEGKMFEFGTPAMVSCAAHQFFDKSTEFLEFSHVAETADGELAVKFLTSPQSVPKLQKVENSDKLKVDAEEIPLDRQTDFKFHIHLEKNKKYVTLVKEQGALTGKYKDRLKEFGKGLFIDEADVDRFKRFFTTSLALDILKVVSFKVEYAEPPKRRDKAS